MDARMYTQDTLEKFIISKACLDDKTLYKYYTENKVKEFRARLGRLTTQKELSKIILTICTDVLRPLVYKLIKRMSKDVNKYGNLIISGGEAFNIYFDKEDRVVTGDIDTKFVPNINPSDPNFFGKIQVVRLAMWNAIGKTAVHGNSTCMTTYNNKLKTSKMAKMLGIQISNDNPFRIRYTLLPKQKKGRRRHPVEGDVFMDVEIFAIDLNVRCYNVEKKRIVTQKLGGILDAPIIRRDEFSSDVYKDFVTTPTGKLASKRFLLEDLQLLVEYGIRKGPKLAKDKIRLKRFIENVLKTNVPKGASFKHMMKAALKQVPTKIKTPRLTIKPFPVNDWRKFDPTIHESIVSPASLSQLTFLLYPVIEDVKALKRVPVNLRFSPGRARWTKILSDRRRGNIMRIRPNKNGNTNVSIEKIKKIRNNVMPILKKGKIPMPSLLYGYVPGRNNWMPIGLIDKAAIIGLLGQLK